MTKAILDYTKGLLSHSEFEAELYLHPELWDELQALMPEDASDPDCSFWCLFPNRELLETEHYRVKQALLAFGWRGGLAHALVSALVRYCDPSVEIREPIDDSDVSFLERSNLDYIGGSEADVFVRELLLRDAGCSDQAKKQHITIPDGKKIGIVGESGCGKTTLIKLISGLYKLQSGTILAEGKTAVVMQGNALFPFTIRENITCGHPVPEEKIWEAVKIAQLEEWINSLDQGLETFAGVRGDNVSGGQAQRICIARAIVSDAPNLILDEATSALDIQTSSKLIEALMDWWQKRQQQGYRQTLISIAHRKEALDFCDEIYHLDGGCLC